MNEDTFHLGIKALIRNNEGKFLLLRVNLEKLHNHSLGAYWDIPGGRIQKGSTVEETLRREVEEETDMTAINAFTKFDMVLSNIRIPMGVDSYGLILGIYICDVDTPTAINISDEHTEYGWFDSKQASELLKVKYPKEFCEKVALL